MGSGALVLIVMMVAMIRDQLCAEQQQLAFVKAYITFSSLFLAPSSTLPLLFRHLLSSPAVITCCTTYVTTALPLTCFSSTTNL